MDAAMGQNEMLKAALSMPWALQELAFYLPGLQAKLIGQLHIHCSVHTLHTYKLVMFSIPVFMVFVRIGSSYWTR